MLNKSKIQNIILFSIIVLLSISSCKSDKIKAKKEIIGAWKCISLEGKDDSGSDFEDTEYGYIEFFDDGIFNSTFDPSFFESLFEVYKPSGGEYKLTNNELSWIFTNRKGVEVGYIFKIKSISNAKLELTFDLQSNRNELIKNLGSSRFNDISPSLIVYFTFTKLPNGIPSKLN